MRVPRPSGPLEPPPPPYTPSTSETAASAPPSVAGEPFELPLRPNPSPITPDSTAGSQGSVGSNVASPADYFAIRPFERGEMLQNEGVTLNFLTESILFNPSTRNEDLCFPEPIEIFFNRDVTYRDWDVFKNYLFPPSMDRPGTEYSVDRMGSQQQEHIRAVVAEWNKAFFGPRRIAVEACFSSAEKAEAAKETESGQRFRSADHTNHSPSSRHHRRTPSVSSISSISSISSVSSISSRDLDSVPPTTIRQLLTTFRADPTKHSHLHSAVHSLRSEFQAQARSVSPEERNNLRKAYRKEHKDLKREIRSILKDARKEYRNERKAIRKANRQERREARQGRKHERKDRRRNSRQCGVSHAERQHAYGQARSDPQVNVDPQLSGIRQFSQNPHFSGNPHVTGIISGDNERTRAIPTPPGSWPARSSLPLGNPPPQTVPRGPQTQGQNMGYMNAVALGLGQWVRAAEDACRLAEQHADDAVRKLDRALEEGEKRLERGLNR